MQDVRNLHSGKVSAAYSRILRAILSAGTKPGQMVDKERISRELGISTQPVTTAIYELQRDGFIQIRPQKGSFVAPIRLRGMQEGNFVTTALLLASCNPSTPEAVRAIVTELEAMNEVMSACLERGSMPQAFNILRDFRHAIIEAAGHRLAIHEAIRARNYQQWGMTLAMKSDRLGQVHARTFQALGARDMLKDCEHLLDAIRQEDAPAFTQAALKIHDLVREAYSLTSAALPTIILPDSDEDAESIDDAA
jgi:DNA-binding GntR family transcriptional regulator